MLSPDNNIREPSKSYIADVNRASHRDKENKATPHTRKDFKKLMDEEQKPSPEIAQKSNAKSPMDSIAQNAHARSPKDFNAHGQNAHTRSPKDANAQNVNAKFPTDSIAQNVNARSLTDSIAQNANARSLTDSIEQNANARSSMESMHKKQKASTPAEVRNEYASKYPTRADPSPPKPLEKSSDNRKSESKKVQDEEKTSDIEINEEPIDIDLVAEADETASMAINKKLIQETQIKKNAEEEILVNAESPWTLYKQMSAQSKAAFSKEEKIEKATTRFSEPQTDLATVNPLSVAMTPVASIEDSVKEANPSVNIAHIKEIVEQIVDKLYTVQTQGQTDTVIVLKQPPLFAGANVVVTSFDTASKEFNLSFENLRPDAKLLLDKSIDSLRIALESKGFANAVHIVTTTTFVERPIMHFDEGTNYARDQREGHQEGREQSSDEEEA